MQLWVSEENIPFFAALASPIRIKILERLAKSDANIKELAEDVGVTSAMMTSHIRKLEEVGLVATSRSKKNGKVCALINGIFYACLWTPINNCRTTISNWASANM